MKTPRWLVFAFAASTLAGLGGLLASVVLVLLVGLDSLASPLALLVAGLGFLGMSVTLFIGERMVEDRR